MKQLTKNLNQLVIERMKSETKEHVSHSQAYEALKIVKTLKVSTTEDVLLFCSAMNLLNTYVKQPDRCFGYYFKQYIDYLFEVLTKTSIRGVKVSMDITVTKKGNTIAYVIVQIENAQFSFHQIKVSDAALELKQSTDTVKDLTFDGIKKQMCSVSIFEMVKNICE